MTRPTVDLAAAHARAPQSPRQQWLAAMYTPNATLDRALAGDAETLRVIEASPVLRMQLGLYQQQKAAYESLYGGTDGT